MYRNTFINKYLFNVLIHSIYTVYLNLGVTKPAVCQLGIFILTDGNLMAAALTSAVMSTPSGALEYSIHVIYLLLMIQFVA